MRAESIIWSILIAWSLPALAQDGEYEEQAPEDEPEVEQAIEPEAQEAAAPSAADVRFDELMQSNAQLARPKLDGAEELAPPEDGKAIVSLDEYERARSVRREKARAAQRAEAPAVVLGAAEYKGGVVGGALSLTVRLDVTLDASNRFKLVPLVGESTILVSATSGGASIPVTRRGGYHVWVTRRSGEADVVLEILVPARGPRGSIEFDFSVPRTPVTKLSCRFPSAGLEPRVDSAVESSIAADGPSTSLVANLRPTTRIHLIGFRDLGAEADEKAKVYAESSNLLSVDDGGVEIFSVVRYTILYGAAKDFTVWIPKDVSVVSAEGEGAFRYVVERLGDGSLVRGETAFPIRGAYEISLRLRRETPKGPLELVAPLPRASGVERELGFLGVEVPGKLKLEELAKAEIIPIDVRQLPPEMVESAVSPVLLAYRYHSPDAKLTLRAERLPEKDPASASVDNVEAVSVLAPEGRMLTQLRITLRNRARPSLILGLRPDVDVRSTLLDDQPVKPSRDEEGRLMLPLKRSEGRDQMDPFTLEIVLESSVGSFGWFGRKTLELPAVDLPISSLEWRVLVPARNTYSRLGSDVSPQSFAGEASWHLSPASYDSEGEAPGAGPIARERSADAGAMPVRIELPESGVELEHVRYWVAGGEQVPVSFTYVRSWLLMPTRILGLLGLTLLFVMMIRSAAPRRAKVALSAMSALLAAWIGVLVPTVAACALVHAWRTGAIDRVRAGLEGAWVTMPDRFRARAKGEPRTWRRSIAQLFIAGTAFTLLLVLAAELFPLLSLLTRPLEG
ncbi:MAG: hypothetical protein HYV07_10615 [Deltaproteobacteria bacterium]|nr:hypothetical protein [Deltaproteobacteria bacterium]